MPTGPSQFAGAKYIEGIHSTEIQPFIGYLLIRDRFYLHGFLSLSAPSSVRDVTMVYNDLGIGYFVYRSDDPDRPLTSIAPTFEVHVNSPLTHRDWFNANDPTGTADVVDLTYGLNADFYRQSVLTFGWVTPVTGPRPFNYEADSPVQLAVRPLPAPPPLCRSWAGDMKLESSSASSGDLKASFDPTEDRQLEIFPEAVHVPKADLPEPAALVFDEGEDVGGTVWSFEKLLAYLLKGHFFALLLPPLEEMRCHGVIKHLLAPRRATGNVFGIQENAVCRQ